MRAVTHDVRRHVARSVRGRRGPAALLGSGECDLRPANEEVQCRPMRARTEMSDAAGS